MDALRAVVRDGGVTSVVTLPPPPRPPGWVRIRVLLAAICLTDVYAATGRLALGGRRVLGHEMVGEVDEADPDGRYRPGDRVSLAPLLACGSCKACANHRRCADPLMVGVTIDGAFANQIVVPESSLVRVPDDLAPQRAAFVEPIAASLAVIGAPIRTEQSGAIVGSGRIADLTVRVLADAGFTVDGEQADGDRDDRAEADGEYDFVVDCVGSDDSVRAALRLVLPGGTIVLKSRPPGLTRLDIARAVRNDVTFVGVGYGSFDTAVELAATLPVDDLFGEILPMEQFDEAMRRTRDEPLGPKLFLAPAGDR